jgi:hypothetical protein
MNQNSSFSQQQKSDDQNLKKTPNPANFKIVKCKNFEKEGQCKYGNTCTFAHGETELRTKTENSMVPGGNNFNSTQPNPMMYQPYMMDPNLLFYMQNQMNYQMNPGNLILKLDPNQIGQFGNLGVDPNSVNLNTSPNSNGNMFDMSNPNFNMGMYSMYQPPQSNINN